MENVIQSIPLVSFDTAGIAGVAYYPLNPLGLTKPCFWLRIINNSNINLLISDDLGVTAKDCVQANSTFQIGSVDDRLLWWRYGQVFYVRNAAAAGGAGVGLVHVAGYYR